MRLIDAERLQLRVNLKGTNKFGMLDENIRDFIDEAPTVDAVPVVRCRDCKWYQESEKLSPNKFCFRLQHPTENRKVGYNFSPDDFCSYGKRKDCGDNG